MAYTNGYACFQISSGSFSFFLVVRELHRPIHTGAPAGCLLTKVLYLSYYPPKYAVTGMRF